MFNQNTRILVTGATGLLGSNLVARLIKMGVYVRCTYNNRRGKSATADAIYGDLQDERICNAATKDIDFVIHCAASTSGAAVMNSTPLAHVTPNLIMNANLMEAAYHNKVKKFLWFASTTGYPDVTIPVTEDMMFVDNPHDKYFYVGWTKRSLEKLCEMYDRLGMPSLVLRPTNIYGPGDKFDPQKSHVLPALIRKIVSKQNPIEVWGDGTEERDLIYVDDMVDAVLLALEKLEGYNPINIGAGHTVTINQILQQVMHIENYNVPIQYIPGPQMIHTRRVDVSKAERLLGFKTKTNLTEGLTKTILWYKENYV